MTEKGHFEKGIWVVDKETPRTDAAGQQAGPAIEKRLSEATDAVGQSVTNAIKVAHDLVATDEGKQYIEKSLKDMHVQIQKSFDDVMKRAKDEIEKAEKEAKNEKK